MHPAARRQFGAIEKLSSLGHLLNLELFAFGEPDVDIFSRKLADPLPVWDGARYAEIDASKLRARGAAG
jgi:hypothetical protein